jgi:hypothetical protein
MSKAISFKVTDDQNEYLEKISKENGMTKSEYIKARLFEDKTNNSAMNAHNLSNYEKDLISTAKKACNLIVLVAEKLTSTKEVEEVVDMADKLLISKGYRKPHDEN